MSSEFKKLSNKKSLEDKSIKKKKKKKKKIKTRKCLKKCNNKWIDHLYEIWKIKSSNCALYLWRSRGCFILTSIWWLGDKSPDIFLNWTNAQINRIGSFIFCWGNVREQFSSLSWIFFPHMILLDKVVVDWIIWFPIFLTIFIFIK